MIDVLASVLVLLALGGALALRASRYDPQLRPLVWLAFAEYVACGFAQILYTNTSGGDASGYARIGGFLSQFLDRSFGTAAPEIVSMLFQRPSRFDSLTPFGSSNSASMCAISALIVFVVRSADYALPLFITGLSLFGVLSIFDALKELSGVGKPRRLFMWTVMFPSLAFWTSSILKEAFCVMGIGAILGAVRLAANHRWAGAISRGVVGVPLVVLFRAPALPPILIGLGVYFVLARIKRTRGEKALLLGPIYVGAALVVVAAGMALVGTVAPSLAPSSLVDTVTQQQSGWALVRGGSSISEPAAPTTPGGALARLPFGLINALFRPQLFDVNSPLVLVSALEMSAVTWVIISALRRRGRALFRQIRSSPFLMMCITIVIVGCSFVGLVTLNFGSLARYRVPFFPFYGALLALISDRSAQPSEERRGRAVEHAPAGAR